MLCPKDTGGRIALESKITCVSQNTQCFGLRAAGSLINTGRGRDRERV